MSSNHRKSGLPKQISGEYFVITEKFPLVYSGGKNCKLYTVLPVKTKNEVTGIYASIKQICIFYDEYRV
jgi:hypothetical protein